MVALKLALHDHLIWFENSALPTCKSAGICRFALKKNKKKISPLATHWQPDILAGVSRKKFSAVAAHWHASTVSVLQWKRFIVVKSLLSWNILAHVFEETLRCQHLNWQQSDYLPAKVLTVAITWVNWLCLRGHFHSPCNSMAHEVRLLPVANLSALSCSPLPGTGLSLCLFESWIIMVMSMMLSVTIGPKIKGTSFILFYQLCISSKCTQTGRIGNLYPRYRTEKLFNLMVQPKG